MGHARCSTVVGLALVLGLVAASPARGQGGRITGRWLGQDRHDYCGERTDSIKPNGYQDIHIALAGLPPKLEIVYARILGFGSGEWQFRGVQNHHGAVIHRKPGATTADVFFEPYKVETGREFTVALKFDDGSEVNVDVKGGKADPDLRMPDAAMTARWVGQERTDHTGPGPGVGPDGLQDVRLALGKLTPGKKVTSVRVEDPASARWAFGINHEGYHNAEFLPDENDPTGGKLYFQPDRDLSGHKLKVTVTYETDKKDSTVVVAGRCDPKLAMPKVSLPKVSAVSVKSRWLGQDGSAETGRGDVHVSLSGLPARRAIAAVVLSDSVRGVWAFRSGEVPGLEVEGDASPLVFRRGTGGTTADLFFAPIRDESKASLTLRFVFPDGDSAVATIPGGACDPGRRAPAVDGRSVVARPGDDLARLVEGGGTVRLAKGEYRLTAPLVLNKPVTVAGEPGVVLTFAQGPNDAPWTTAIKIHSGGTTLKDFAVRFAGQVRWKDDVSWSPAVIGTTDNFDTVPNLPKFNLSFERLDIEGPPPSGKGPWEEAVKLMRLTNAACGRVVNNVLRGGLIELFGGPWVVEDNDYRGTRPATFSFGVLAVHDPFDVVVRNNKAKPVGPSGKSWRFLVFTGRGYLDRVENNVIEQVGPRDDDTITGFNSPEVMLTESYYLWFEGKPAAVSADGRLVKLGSVRGMAPRTGDVVSVVAGAAAGQWRRIAQRIEPTAFWLDAPLPKGADVISITPGFVDEAFEGNSVDARGGRGAACLVLAGNQFGARVRNNRFLGAGEAFRLLAFPSEVPSIWGWTHVPFFGGLVEGNVIEDSETGGSVGVDHGPAIKSNKGRVYMTVTLKDNIVRWSEPFLSRLARTEAKRPAAGITLGVPGSFDPGELVVDESGNRLDAPPRALSNAVLKVNAALLNGRALTNRELPLPAGRPPASTGLGSAGAPKR
jgi:hypothetical protein